MKAESVNEPELVGDGHVAVVEFFAVVSDGNVIPGPVAVAPVVEILNEQHIAQLIPFDCLLQVYDCYVIAAVAVQAEVLLATQILMCET